MYNKTADNTQINNLLKKSIVQSLTNMDFKNAPQVLNEFSVKLYPQKQTNFNLNKLELNLLKLISHNYSVLEHNDSFLKIISIMQEKTKQQACESVLKLILYCHSEEKVNSLYSNLTNAEKNLATYFMSQHEEYEKEIKKVLGYLLSLNFDKYTYSEIAYFSLQPNQLDLNKLVNDHLKSYSSFIKMNKLASEDSSASKNRRDILYHSGLLETYLQRDPEESEKYNEQMASAQLDKDQLLEEVTNNMHPKVAVVDIGPAGGATFKSVVAKGYQRSKKLHYYGVEFDNKELTALNNLLENYNYLGKNPREFMKHVSFLQGNAFALSEVLSSIKKTNNKINNYFLSIVLSSVIHEIYSYCKNQEPATHTADITTMAPSCDSRYNPESIYKIYYEALKTIKEHRNGGSLNIRDGVMCRNANALVEFSINDAKWLNMFKDFLEDSKYIHLKQEIKTENLILNQKIKISAKYLQEFVLKANWGPESFGNEINEVYCYLSLEDHIKLIQRAADALSMKIDIPVAKEYVQNGYRTHINESKITFFSGFNLAERFPSTNMLIRVIKAETENDNPQNEEHNAVKHRIMSK